MSRLRRIANRDRIFFVTTNIAHQVPALAPLERDLILKQLASQHASADFLLFGYVVMPTHVHLLLAPAGLDLIQTMHRFKRFTAEQIVRLRQQQGSLWQERYFDFVLRRVHDFWEKLEYIHGNPVVAGLVRRAEDWGWSSAAHYSRSSVSSIIDSAELPADREALLWPAPWR